MLAQGVDSFNPGTEPNGYVFALGLQSDSKIVVGGSFLKLAGQTRNYLGRLYADGTLDPAFTPLINSYVTSVAIQPDGKILVGGGFWNLPVIGNQGHLIRLNSDGSFDRSFTAAAGGDVNFISVGPDDRILVGGAFTNIGGQTRSNLARLNPDGTLDTSFNAAVDGPVYVTALQSDGKLLVGGGFSSLSGLPASNIGRLNGDGTADTTFVGRVGLWGDVVYGILARIDGSILVCGRFSSLGDQMCHNVGRVHPDGTVADTFGAGADGEVRTMVAEAGGRVLFGGMFGTFMGQPRAHVARQNTSGSLDALFNPAFSGIAVNALAIQSDGNVLAGGGFDVAAGQNRTNLARITNTEAVTDSLSFDGTAATWTHGGTAPEVWYTLFEACTNGNDWLMLGPGIRGTQNWSIANLAYPSDTTIRVRGQSTGGLNNGSSWLVETATGKPAVALQPASVTNNARTTAYFNVRAIGTTNITYAWLRNGAPLNEGAHVVGSATPSLSISNVLGPDAGSYSVMLSNAIGCVTSQVATLTVRDPLIGTQPLSRSISLNQSATFTVTVIGSAPFFYQWRRQGSPLPGASNSVLTVNNSQAEDAGQYDVIVTNQFGAALSAQATLTVNAAVSDSMNLAPSNTVRTVLLQPNGKMLVAGDFTNIAGQVRLRIAQFNAEGNLDGTFNVTINSSVYCLASQGDGRVVLGGSFTTCGGYSRNRLARLNPDYSVDPSFNPGASGQVSCMAVQVDGKILLGGLFALLGNVGHSSLGRLNSDGTTDASFMPSANNEVASIALQPDGKILIGGSFTTVNSQTRHYLARLNVDGTVDPGFNPAPDGTVRTVLVQPNGQILVGGLFTKLGNQIRFGFGRLDPDGTVDGTFIPLTNNSVIQSLALQTDGRITVGGSFTAMAGQSRYSLARLKADATADPTFNPGADGLVTGLAIQPDGQTIVVGSFATLAGVPRRFIGRLASTSSTETNLVLKNGSVQWIRAGASPEVWRVSFEAQIGRTNWVYLGDGSRETNGWKLTNLPVLSSEAIRGRGYVVNEHASQFVEQSLPLPSIVVDDGYFGLGSTGFSFHISGSSGQVVIVERSEDLLIWFPVYTNALSTSPLLFADPAASGSRFYRTRLQY